MINRPVEPGVYNTFFDLIPGRLRLADAKTIFEKIEGSLASDESMIFGLWKGTDPRDGKTRYYLTPPDLDLASSIEAYNLKFEPGCALAYVENAPFVDQIQVCLMIQSPPAEIATPEAKGLQPASTTLDDNGNMIAETYTTGDQATPEPTGLEGYNPRNPYGLDYRLTGLDGLGFPIVFAAKAGLVITGLVFAYLKARSLWEDCQKVTFEFVKMASEAFEKLKQIVSTIIEKVKQQLAQYGWINYAVIGGLILGVALLLK